MKIFGQHEEAIHKNTEASVRATASSTTPAARRSAPTADGTTTRRGEERRRSPVKSGISPNAAVGPHLLILNRADAVDSVQKYFAESLAQLRELLNEGTRLEVRGLQSGAGELDVVIPLAVLYHRILTLVDSIEVLISAGQSYGARIILRALLETGWSLDWMLRENVARRIGQYYVADIRRRVAELARVEHGTDEHSRFKAALGHQAHLLDCSEQEDNEIRSNRQQLIRKLRDEPRFRAINDKAERIHKKWKREPEWYPPRFG